MVTSKDTAGEFVDLGLSVKWATGNIVKDGTKYSIGAPADRGCYFSWANVEGHNKGEGYNFDSTTYKSTPGWFLSGDISSTVGYDAAMATIGYNWRMPTKDECQELIDNCTITWTTQDGVYGMKFTSKKSGYTDNSIFIPASGYYSDTSLGGDGSNGRYWSSTRYSTGAAWYLFFNPTNLRMDNYARNYGFTVRAVTSYVMDTNVLFYNTASSQYKVFNISDFPSNDLGWTPIAIEVVPPSHDRYGDGSGSYMSLGVIDSGGTIQTNGAQDRSRMAWSTNNNDTSLTNYMTSDGSNGAVYVPRQANSESTLCSFYDAGNDIPQIQYPYTTLNGAEKQTYTAGCLSDYDGVGNTNILNSSEYPTAYACKQVSTLGTSKGDWYLPSAGELAYLPSVRFEVNKTIFSLQSTYGNVGSLLGTNSYYWASNEGSSSFAWVIGLGAGYVNLNSRTTDNFALLRAFLRFNPSTSTIVR